MMITQADLDACKARLQAAASQSYEASQKARGEYQALLAAWTAQQPERRVIVVGNTYPHRDALKRLGLKWDAGTHAWTGVVRGGLALPAGCRETTAVDAALASMSHAGSAY